MPALLSPTPMLRHGFPVYPQNMQLVQVNEGASPDDNGLWLATAITISSTGNFKSAAKSALTEPCLIANINGNSLSPGKIYLGRLNGQANDNTGRVLPLFFAPDPLTAAPILGKTTQGIANNSFSGTQNSFVAVNNVQVYSVPTNGTQGAETAESTFIPAFNKFFGYIPTGTWVWCDNDGDGCYVTECQGDHFVGYIDNASDSVSQVTLFAPTSGQGAWTQVSVRIQPNDQATISTDSTLPLITAAVRHRPVLNSERVELHWTGSIFTIGKGEFDGGLWCQNTGSQVSKGGTFPEGTLLVALTGTTPSKTLVNSGVISTPLGDFPQNKKGRIAWDHAGGGAIAAEC